MDHATLTRLRTEHPAWRLLASEHAALVASFVHGTFLRPNVRTLPQHEAVSRLEDHLFALRERHGEDTYPRPARQYLETWADAEHAWFRRYYPADSDEPWVDLTPAAEKAVAWLATLERRAFVGTESRLWVAFELLRQIVRGTETDPAARIAELERQRATIDAEIERLRAGDVPVLEDAQVRDRFQQFAATARELLGDFREVEDNFRALDRDVREKIALWDGAKGQLLDEVFGARDAIGDSDQGRSFRAFRELLLSPERQDELRDLLETVLALPSVSASRPDARLARVHHDWLTAAEATQRTVARLSDQLRRFLDDRTWLENRRIMQLVRAVEQHAVALRASPPRDTFTEIDALGPEISLAMERPLFTPPFKPVIRTQARLDDGAALDAAALFAQSFVDRTRLSQNIRAALRKKPETTLAEILADTPLEEGLAELVTYLDLAAHGAHGARFDDTVQDVVAWTDPARGARHATLSRVVFRR